MKSLAMAALALLLATPAFAQGWIEPVPGIRPATVVKIHTSVSVHVTGRIAQVEVEEWFENRGGGLGEGEYLYPLPQDAVFSNLSLFQGDQELRGETMDADHARGIYEAIVRQRRDPALVELIGHGLLRARIFPIPPGTQRRIVIRFTEMLRRNGDALEFRYAATRPTAGSGEADAPASFTLVADSASRWRAPFSPTHALRSRRMNDALTVQVDSALRGDLALFLPVADRTVGLALATYRVDDEPGYFMLTLSPGEPQGRAERRDVTAVIDVSGSMSGEKIAQARAALRQLLGRLAEGDRFRLIRFSGDVAEYATGWTEVSPTAVRDAGRWIDALEADGGTNIAGALRAAFRTAPADDHLPIVVFLTDGLPSVGEQNPERIADEASSLRGRTRVFAFGVGNDVNTYLLDRLSAAARGATEYVAPGEDVERAIGTLASKIQHPVLTDLALEAPVRITDVYPVHLPDLFAGEDLVVFGRYEPAEATSTLTVTGRRSSRTERYSSTVRFPAHAEDDAFIPRLWASRKIGFLQQQVRLEGASPALIEEIRRTALRYGLVSEYTSYLVQEPAAELATHINLNRAPAAAQGAKAVQEARLDQAYRSVKSVAELVADTALAPTASPASTGGAPTRRVAGRTFALHDGVWTDLRQADSLPLVTIAPYSEAYFTLLRAAPELLPYAKAFDTLEVTGIGARIRFAPGGVTVPKGIAALVRRFRGT